MAANAYADCVIKVDTGIINGQATAVSDKISSVETALSEISSIVNKTQSYWLGEAGDKHRSDYEKLKPELEEILTRFKGHVTALQEIAGNYGAAADSVLTIMEALPEDVII